MVTQFVIQPATFMKGHVARSMVGVETLQLTVAMVAFLAVPQLLLRLQILEQLREQTVDAATASVAQPVIPMVLTADVARNFLGAGALLDTVLLKTAVRMDVRMVPKEEAHNQVQLRNQ
jgi:hypothetical protein